MLTRLKAWPRKLVRRTILWYLHRHGMAVVDAARVKRAVGELGELEGYVTTSGILSNSGARRVRKRVMHHVSRAVSNIFDAAYEDDPEDATW